MRLFAKSGWLELIGRSMSCKVSKNNATVAKKYVFEDNSFDDNQ